MKQIKFLVLGILFLVAGFLLGLGFDGQSATGERGEYAQTEQPTSIMIDTGSELLGFSDRSVAEGDTVWSLLERTAAASGELSVAATDYGDLGILIGNINGYENGADKKYWQYWVNNKYAEVAADAYAVRPGDVIMWKFTSSLFKNYE
ncbi:MAG: DUF4430 domain-containing protein [Parcubacteria group bacterium]|nr:DUF4430 domain-containing protein [Parcubacteria group bacterium]